MNSSLRRNRSKSRINYKEESSMEDIEVGNISRRSRKSRSCSPLSISRNARTLRISLKKCDSAKNFSARMTSDGVVLSDLKTLDISNYSEGNNDNSQNESVRKSRRPKRKTVHLIEAEESQRLQRRAASKVDYDDRFISDPESNDGLIAAEKVKQSALFDNNDIEGKRIFGFQSPKKRDSVFRKNLENHKPNPTDVEHESSANIGMFPQHFGTKKLDGLIPRTPRRSGMHTLYMDISKSSAQSKTSTPVSKFKNSMNDSPKNPQTPTRKSLFGTVGTGSVQEMTATPKAVRNKIKKEIAKQIETDDSDFSASESSQSEPSESSDSSSMSSEYSDDDEMEIKRPVRGGVNKQPTKTAQRTSRVRPKKGSEPEYILKSDNYFSMQGSKKIVTSNHTLERLKNPQLTEDKLQDMMENISVSAEHVSTISDLNKDHSNFFDKWIYYMSEGFNLLLYGVGSKIDIIGCFLKYAFEAVNIPCFVVNGYFPGLTVKDILKSIIIDLLELTSAPTNIGEAISLIDDHLTVHKLEIALAVHNIDGPMLRNDKAQYIFSKLANIKNIYFVASMDHIRAPLFWGSSKLRNFNFSWWDVTTFKPYIEETVNENLSLVHKAGALALSSVKNVFLSLNAKARGIFFIIAKKQIRGAKSSHYQGLAYQELYSLARESFFVSSDFALRTQLTEFIDHKLIKIKRTADGAEHLLIPIDNNLLQVFMEQQEEL